MPTFDQRKEDAQSSGDLNPSLLGKAARGSVIREEDTLAGFSDRNALGLTRVQVHAKLERYPALLIGRCQRL